uniref:Uncharacterized protein n=1 Tax=Sus scrofa TaxID=9823 RepID=A0A480GYB2_PIG
MCPIQLTTHSAYVSSIWFSPEMGHSYCLIISFFPSSSLPSLPCFLPSLSLLLFFFRFFVLYISLFPSFLPSFSLFLSFLLSSCTHGIWKFPGQ